MTQDNEGKNQESADLARDLVDGIADRKGSEIVMLDVRPVSILADYFIICTGATERQIKAIVDEVLERADQVGMKPFHIEGTPDSGWVIVDYGSIIAHIFMPAQRDYYQLERLWADASLVVSIQ
jgi:ribosome-associated protein